MARVKYNIGQVKNKNLPSVRFTSNATPEMFGAGNARDLAKVGSSLVDAGSTFLQMQQLSQAKRDKSVVRDQLNQSRSELRQYMAEVYSKKGEEAIDVYEEVEKKVNDIRKNYSQKFANENQKSLFNSSFDPMMNNHLNRAIAFQEKSRVEYERMTLDAENQAAIDDAVAARTDKNEIIESKKTIIANTMYANKGMGKEIQNKAVDEAVHNLHMSVVDALVTDSPEAALGYVKENAKEINPRVKGKLEKELEKKAENVWVRNKAVEIANSGLDYEGQLKAVDKIENPEKAKKVRTLVNQREKENKIIRKAKENEVNERAWDDMFQDPAAYKVPMELPAKTQLAMYKYKSQVIKAIAAEKGAAEKPVTNWNMYTKFMTMPEKELAKIDMTDYINDLAPTEYKAIVKMQRDARFGSGNSKGQKAFRVRTLYAQAQQAINTMKDFDPKEGEKESQRSDRFYEQFSRRVEAIPSEERTEERVGEVIENMLKPATIDILGPFNKIVYRFEAPYLEEDEQGDLYEQNLPESLKAFKGVKFHTETKRYFVDGDDIRDIYDENGNYIKSYRKAVK